MQRVVKVLLVCTCLIYVVFLSSCKTKKYIHEFTDSKIDKVLIDSILSNHNIDFEWYVAKSKIKFQAPGVSESGTAYIRIRQDSVIWMVMKRYSIEGFRIQMTHDSITILDRLEKIATSSTWEEISDWTGFEFDYNKMEDLIVGNIFYDSTATNVVNEDSLNYVVTQSNQSFVSQFLIPFFEKRVNEYVIQDYNFKSLKTKFDNCRPEDSYCFLRTFTVPLEEEKEIYLSISISDLKIDTPKNIKFEIPPHYTWY